MPPAQIAERIRALAAALAAPGADPLALSRQLAALASELEHAAYPARPNGQPTPGLRGAERLWRKP